MDGTIPGGDQANKAALKGVVEQRWAHPGNPEVLTTAVCCRKLTCAGSVWAVLEQVGLDVGVIVHSWFAAKKVWALSLPGKFETK